MHSSAFSNSLKRLSHCAVLALCAASATLATAAPTLVEVGAAPGQDAIRLVDGGLEKAIAALPTTVDEILKRSGVPGVAVAVVHGGKTIFAQGFGVRQLGKPNLIDIDTVFQIASLSKPITATVTAIEVTNKVVQWDDPVSRHLPQLKLSDPYITMHATIGDFMAHRTGLPPTAGDDLEDLGFSRQQIIERLRYLPLDSFRSSYHYANFGTTIGAEAVAAAAGKPWETLAADILFKPLGMKSTSSRHADYLAHDNRAVLHALEDGRFQPLFDRNPDEQSPAGGVSSTVRDLAEWVKFLLAKGLHQGNQLASPEALLAAMSAHSFNAPAHRDDSRPGFYGYGFNVNTNANGRMAFSHSGAFLLGGATAFQIIPSADIGIIVLTNGAPVGAAESIAMQFMDTLQYGAALRDWYAGYNGMMRAYFDPEGDLVGTTSPANPHAAHDLNAYTGRYGNPYFGEADITAENGQLVLTMGPRRDRLVMTHWDGDTFAVRPRSENASQGSNSSVAFVLKNSKATEFRVQYLDNNGMGTWKK